MGLFGDGVPPSSTERACFAGNAIAEEATCARFASDTTAEAAAASAVMVAFVSALIVEGELPRTATTMLGGGGVIATAPRRGGQFSVTLPFVTTIVDGWGVLL